MPEEREGRGLRGWIGPGLLVMVVLAGGGLLDVAANG